MTYKNTCEQYAATVKEKENHLRHSLKQSPRKIRIHHHVRTPLQYFFELGAAFATNPRFDYTVVLADALASFTSLFSERNIPVATISELTSAANRPDILFLQHPNFHIGNVEVDFYGIMSRLPPAILPESVEAHPLLCYIPYAYSVINDEAHSPTNGHYNLPIHNVAWRVFCESEWHKEQVTKKSEMGGNNWVVTGYPKLDGITEAPAAKGNLWRTAGPAMKRVIWAPHHNKSFQTIPTLDVHRFLAALVDETPGVELIFRPHPNILASGFSHEALGLTKDEFNSISNFWVNHPRGQLNMTANMPELFGLSDMMITNSGGFHIEYLPSMKPLISYIPQHRLNRFVTKITNDANYMADTIEEISRLVRKLLGENGDDKREKRRECLNIVMPTPNVSAEIVKNIETALLG